MKHCLLLAGILAALIPSTPPLTAWRTEIQQTSANRVQITGVLVNDADAPLQDARINVCPEGKDGKPLLILGTEPVVLDGVESRSTADGRFEFDVVTGERSGFVTFGKTPVAVDVRVRLCITGTSMPRYRWVGPWLDLTILEQRKPIALGRVKPSQP